jgi:hypothetical protein
VNATFAFGGGPAANAMFAFRGGLAANATFVFGGGLAANTTFAFVGGPTANATFKGSPEAFAGGGVPGGGTKEALEWVVPVVDMVRERAGESERSDKL